MICGPKHTVKNKVSRGKEGRKSPPPQSLKQYFVKYRGNPTGDLERKMFRNCALAGTTFACDMFASFCYRTQGQTLNIDIVTRFMHVIYNSYNKKVVKT